MIKKYKNNLSYEKYLKNELETLSPNLGLKVYKRAGSDINLKATFDKDKDYRVMITWKKEPIFQFIVERIFWHMANTNDGDRDHMRRWAKYKLDMIADAIRRGKEKKKKE